MIRTTNLTKRYGSFLAVDGIDLNIPAGQIYGFLGPNGAGKTSTIMMLLGINRPTSGEIYLFGERYTPERLDLRKRIGVVPEKHPHGTWSWMTGREYLELFTDLFQVREAKLRINHLLEQVGLAEAQAKRVKDYSRGMLQKLSIVRALLHDPDILVLDEPISGLDPLGIKQVRDLIMSENREGRTIFISSHLLSEMEKICGRVAIIYRGRLMAEDTMGALLSRIAKDREIHIDLETLPDELPERIARELPFVLDGRREGTTLIVKISKEGDFRKALSEYLIASNHIPLSIQEKALTLEEAFVTITRENVQLFAAEERSGQGTADGGRL
ncbi:MAG TPA: ABC transporter ATP-binding protein [Spirochaetia bacterium]|nr:ABC transporter ATP-binding protein [Spirochaetia bacterium]